MATTGDGAPLCVGITGHRPNKLAKAAVPRIERQLRDMMQVIDEACRAAGRPVRLISGFAEGADQMAVAACPRDWTVEAILPFPKDEYLKDFAQSARGDGRDVRGAFLSLLTRAAVVRALPPTDGAREQHYLAAGRAMLDRVSLLIAVWDGEPPKTGGTGQIAKEAWQRSFPVVWLSTTAERPPVLIEAFDGGTPRVSNKPWTVALSPLAQPTPSRPA